MLHQWEKFSLSDANYTTQCLFIDVRWFLGVIWRLIFKIFLSFCISNNGRRVGPWIVFMIIRCWSQEHIDWETDCGQDAIDIWRFKILTISQLVWMNVSRIIRDSLLLSSFIFEIIKISNAPVSSMSIFRIVHLSIMLRWAFATSQHCSSSPLICSISAFFFNLHTCL